MEQTNKADDDTHTVVRKHVNIEGKRFNDENMNIEQKMRWKNLFFVWMGSFFLAGRLRWFWCCRDCGYRTWLASLQLIYTGRRTPVCLIFCFACTQIPIYLLWLFRLQVAELFLVDVCRCSAFGRYMYSRVERARCCAKYSREQISIIVKCILQRKTRRFV